MADNDPLANFDDKRLRLMIEQIKRGREETKLWEEAFDAFSTTLFGISGSAFFKSVPKSMEEISETISMANKALLETRMNALNLEQAFRFKSVIDGAGNVTTAIDTLRQSVSGLISNYSTGTNDITDILKKLDYTAKKGKKSFESLSLDEQVTLMKLMNSEGLDFLESITNVDEKVKIIKELLEDNDDTFIKTNKHLLKQLSTHESIRDVLREETDEYDRSRLEYERLLAMSQDRMRDPSLVEMLKNGIKEWSKNFAKGAVTNLFEVDTALHEIQRNTGIMVAEGVKGVSKWTMHMAEFGVSVKDASQLMEGLGTGLGTTDLRTIMDATESLASLPKALGISADEMSTITSEMMRMGHSVEDVKDSFSDANVSAKLVGISSRNLVKQISKNIDKMRQFGFEGGIKSLTLMAAKAEKMRIQVDEIFDVAKRARTIEGAMDMAAQLQLAGGSFSNINPMELLSAARKGPEELGRILTTMGGDIGHWSEDMKTYEFDPVDVDRLNIVAEATGMSLDSIQKVIQKNADVNKKTEMIPDSMFNSAIIRGIDGMDAALAKSTISDFMEWDASSKTMKLTTDEKKLKMLQRAGITDISQINDQTMASFFELNKNEQKSLEEQAKQNMSLKESYDAFTASLTNVFTAFQPVMESITNALNWFSTHVPDWGKQLMAGLVLGLPLIKGAFSTLLKPLFSSIASIMPFGKKAGADTGGIAGLAGSLRGASDAAGGIKMGNLLKFSAALGIVGLSVIGFMAGLNAIGGTASLAQLGAATASLAIMAGGLLGVSMIAKAYSTADILKFSLALAIIGAAMIPFAFSMNMMKDVGWEAVLASVVMMELGIVALMAIGALMTGPQAVFLLEGAAALALVGLSMMAAATALNIAGDAIGKLASIDWSAIMMMGAVMAMVSPAMLAFGLAAMAFANPIAMVGMGLMVLQLLGLAAVMLPLSKGLSLSAVSIERFVIAMKAMKDSVRGLDIKDVFASISDAVSDMSDALEDSNLDAVSKALSSISINIDTSSIDGLKSAISSVPSIMVHVDRAELDRIGSSLTALKISVDDGQLMKDVASLPSIKLTVDKTEIENLGSSMSSLKVIVDRERLMKDIASLPAMQVKVDASGIISEIKSIPSIDVKIDMESIADAIGRIPNVNLGVDDRQLSSALDTINKESSIEIELNASQLRDVQAMLEDKQISIDVSELNKALLSMPMLKMSVDIASLLDQLNTLPPFEIKVETSEMERMVALLSSIRVSLDLADLQSVMSGFKIGVDTSQLDASLSQFQSFDAQKIGAALSSIEATISKVGEERTAAVKTATDQLGSSNSKLQAEVIMRLAEAIERLGNGSKDKDEGDRKLVIELEMDGRQIKNKIIKDTSLQA